MVAGATQVGDKVLGGLWVLPADLRLLYTWRDPAQPTSAGNPAKAETATQALGRRAEPKVAAVPGRSKERSLGREVGTPGQGRRLPWG